ncbi:MAG: histidine--tRNA ligase [Candidatus Acidiferrales bacterium]
MSEAAKSEGEKRKFRAIKGTRDILPPDSALWNWFEKTARSVMESYNFGEIRLPIFEETELFARAVGVDTDVVKKEMYSFEDHDLLEMEQHRAALTTLHPSVDRLAEFESYESRVNIYLERLDGHIAKGDVPKTPENFKAIQSIGKCLHQMNLFARQFVSDQSHSAREGFTQYATGIVYALRSIRFGDVLTLRPEATASVCRAYIEHGMHTRPGDQKLYYIGPMFRRERPQKGRYRQFYQIGAEVLGASDAPAIDAELIEMLTVLLTRCQIEKWTLLVNSIGCADCRPKYVERLRAELRKPEIFSKLGADSQRRVETNPLRVMDSKLPEEQPIIEKLPKITEHLCAECREHYEKLKKELSLRKVPFTESPRLVRGLDYYMRTTFEITSPVLGAQNALCGGGRYDGLVEMLGGPRGIKGIGFALGEDRFIDAIVEAKKIGAAMAVDVFIAWMGQNAYLEAVRLARVLRDAKCVVELPPEEMKFRKAFERADKIGARFVLIIGDDEIASKQLTLKRLADGVQEKIAEAALLDYIRR